MGASHCTRAYHCTDVVDCSSDARWNASGKQGTELGFAEVQQLSCGEDIELEDDEEDRNFLRRQTMAFTEMLEDGRALVVNNLGKSRSSSCQMALSGSWDGTLRLWYWEGDDGPSGCSRLLAGHSGHVRDVAVSWASMICLSASSDRTLKLWDINAGKCIRTLEGHKDAVHAVAADWTHMLALSGSYDKTAKLWNLHNGECIRTLEGHFGGVTSLVVNWICQVCLTGCGAGNARLWDMKTGKCTKQFHAHESEISSVSADWAMQKALTASHDRKIRIWGLVNQKCVMELKGHTDGVTSVSVDWAEQRALSASSDKSMRLWNIASGSCLQVFRGDESFFLSVTMDCSNHLAISGSGNCSVRVWKLQGTGRCIRSFEGHKAGVLTVKLGEGVCPKVPLWKANRDEDPAQALDLLLESSSCGTPCARINKVGKHICSQSRRTSGSKKSMRQKVFEQV